MSKNKTEHSKVVILIGVQNSGKTTWAKEFVRKNPRYVMVSRDSFRLLLRNEYTSTDKTEKLITELQDKTIISALERGFNVIIDNTHLKEEHIEHLLQLLEGRVDIEFRAFETSLKKVLERNELRGNNKIAPKNLKKYFEQYLKIREKYVQSIKALSREQLAGLYFESKVKYDPTLEDAVIFDIDGTLAIMNRYPYDMDEVERDYVNDIVVEHLKMHKEKGRKIVLVSGRDGIARKRTVYWLQFYDIPYDELFMRPQNDIRRDSVIKEEIYNKYIKGRYNILVVFDDRDQVVETWRKLGLHCFQVNKSPL